MPVARTTKGQGCNPDLSQQPDDPPIGASLSRFTSCVNRSRASIASGSEDPPMCSTRRAARPVKDLDVKPGNLVMCNGKLCRVLNCVSFDKIHVQVEGTQEYQWVTVGDLSSYSGHGARSSIRHISDVDPAQEESAQHWTRALRTAAKADGTRLRKSTCSELANQFKVSVKTVRRRWRLYCNNSARLSSSTSLS